MLPPINSPFQESIEYYRIYTNNTALHLGLIFQRKIATRFDTNIHGNNFKAVCYETQGFYADILFLVIPDPTRISDDLNITDGSTVGLNDLFTKKSIGAIIGYKRVISKNVKGSPASRFRIEAGLQPGYFPDLQSRIIIRAGIGVGIGKKK